MGDPAETFLSSQVPLHTRGTSIHWAEVRGTQASGMVPRSPEPHPLCLDCGLHYSQGKANKMDLTQDTPRPLVPSQAGGAPRLQVSPGILPRKWGLAGLGLLHLCKPLTSSQPQSLPSPGLGPHPHCRKSLALCPRQLAVVAAEDSRVRVKARGAVVVPASVQGWKCL